MDYKTLMYNINVILKKYSKKEILILSNDLKYEERLKFLYKVDCLLQNKSYQESFASYCYEEEFLKELINNNELEYIVNNIDKIIIRSNSLKDIPLSYLKENEDKISKKDMMKIETSIARATSMYYPNTKEEDMIKIKDLLSKVAKDENTTLLDLRTIDYGYYSKVYKIKNKIVKVGYKRECPNIPDNNRILYPYFKGYIGSDYVEVTDYISEIGNITDDEIYEVYKDIRNEGLIWLDPGKENLARVSSDILYKMNQRRKDLTDKGIIDNNKHVVELKDILLIDLDHIVFENDDDNIERIRRKLSEPRLAMLDRLEIKYCNEMNKNLVFKKALSDYPIFY